MTIPSPNHPRVADTTPPEPAEDTDFWSEYWAQNCACAAGGDR